MIIIGYRSDKAMKLELLRLRLRNRTAEGEAYRARVQAVIDFKGFPPLDF